MSDDWRSRARKIPKGNLYDDFRLGQVFEHHWGRTLNEGDNTLFSTLTLSFNPLYFNAPYARAHGHHQVVVNPMLVFLTVFGLSVEDLSEAGGLFLGVDNLTFHRRVYPGQTLVARSTVVDKRESTSRPRHGIVTWHTEGFMLENASGNTGEQALVVNFRRSNLIPKRGIDV
ncbi:MAG TPA: MaoC family dehydratase [Candidatus Binataceae bacterium]|nr:MaoC family dehydratase [Candidatus Binataceae bacterium]